jgi:hydroxymethylbilane synthase
LNVHITGEGNLIGDGVPDGLLATVMGLEVMLPCVGQGALGIETRANDERITSICERLNHPETQHCVTAERAFLSSMGGGCQSPVAAYAEMVGNEVWLRAVSFRDEKNVRRGEAKRAAKEAFELGKQMAERLI